ncbi:MAG TPA: methyltransferase domain-containing protein [Candidatus Acidoferrales bacterium]|nr:methyltransferase domain-containing protein [Candidatus Acidoferrales bacterium]
MSRDEHADQAGTSDIHERVSAQFGAAAANYSSSLTHSDPEALRKVVELARPKSTDIALDIATGAGHTALALAPHVAKVIAYDMTEEMLAETRRNAAARGLANVSTQQGIAESLPFPDATFDIVSVRQAPHHFTDVRAAVREMARVAKPGARVIVIDSTAPEDESLERQWNHIEKLRDPSHVRNYRPSEWREIVAAAGLKIVFEELGSATEKGRPMDFSAWIRRINTPPAEAAEVTRLFRTASPALAEALRIETIDGALYFCVPQITIVALKQ